MKVGELIELLQKHDPEVTVATEGCDCFGDPAGVVTAEEYFSGGQYAGHYVGSKNVLITRKGDFNFD